MGRLPAKRLIDLGLPRGVGQMIVAANDVRHPHVVIVDDDGEHVGRVAVGAQEHKIVEILVGEDDLALHLVVDDSFALLGGAQADHRLDAGRRFGRIAVAPAAIVAHRLALETRFFAHLFELLDACVTAVGAARAKQLPGDLAMALGAFELADRLAVPVEPEPFEPVDNRVDGGLSRTLAIGVLDAQQEFSVGVLRVKPVEQSRACAPDMQEAGRRRREAGDNLRHFHGLEGGIAIERVALAE